MKSFKAPSAIIPPRHDAIRTNPKAPANSCHPATAHMADKIRPVRIMPFTDQHLADPWQLFAPQHVHQAMTTDAGAEKDPADVGANDLPDLAGFFPMRVRAHGV